MTAEAISTTTETHPMQPQTTSGSSKARSWVGRVLSTVAVLFFTMDGGMKLFKPPFVVAATVLLGYRESTIIGIGTTLLLCTLLYVIPRTAVLGAIITTGYLGGAVASNVRAGTPLFNMAFPLIMGCLVWGGLWLRYSTLRRLVPLVDKSGH